MREFFITSHITSKPFVTTCGRYVPHWRHGFQGWITWHSLTWHPTSDDWLWHVLVCDCWCHVCTVCECRIWSFTPKVVQNVHTVDIIIYGDATSALFFTDMDMYINLCLCVCVCVCSRQMSCSKYCTLSGAQKNVEVLASCDFHPKVLKTTAIEECGVFGCNLLFFFFLLSVLSVNHMRAEWTGITGAMRTHLSCDRSGQIQTNKGCQSWCNNVNALFWIAAVVINIHLHKASVFFHSHDDRSIENLKNNT